MLIRGVRGDTADSVATGSDFGAPIVASAEVVRHRGKHYLRNGALRTYVPMMRAELRARLPGGRA
jgi:hypothetical protein